LRLVVAADSEDACDSTALSQSQSESAAQAQFGAHSDAIGEPGNSTGPPVSVKQLRELVDCCDDLPEHIRAAVLALLETVSPSEPNAD